MSYAVSGLPIDEFRPLFGLPDAELAERGVVRRVVDSPSGFPSRVELEDAKVGDTVLLLNYEHQPADTLANLPRSLSVGFAATLDDVDDGAAYRRSTQRRGR